MGNKCLRPSSHCRPFPHDGSITQAAPIASSLRCCVLEGSLEDAVDPIPPAQHAECMKMAISSSDPNQLEKILRQGVDPNVKWFEPALEGIGNPSTGTGLHFATALHDEAMLTLLLKHSADVNIKNYFGETALHTAGYVGNSSALLMLLEDKNLRCLNSTSERRCKNQDRRAFVNCTALEMAVSHKKVPCVKVLLRNGAKMGKTVQKLIDLMNEYDDAELCKLLLRQGLAINRHIGRYKRTLLHLAAEKCNSQVVAVLLGAGAKVNAQAANLQTPLTCFIQSVWKLNYPSKEINCALIKRKEDVIEQLIQAGADVNISDVWGTPLHQAAQIGDFTTIEKLIHHGANLTSVSHGRMPHYKTIQYCSTVNRESAQNLSHFYALHILLLHGAPLDAGTNLIGGYESPIVLAWQGEGPVNPQVALLMCHGARSQYVIDKLMGCYVYKRDSPTLPLHTIFTLIFYSGNENYGLRALMKSLPGRFLSSGVELCEIVPSLKIQSRRSIRRLLRRYAKGYSIWNCIGKTNLPPLLQNYLRLPDLCNFGMFHDEIFTK